MTTSPTAHGCIHVYTGNGKGKTTAALGLTLRALGAGMRVYLAHFLKHRVCSEHHALEAFGDAVTVAWFGSGSWLRGREPSVQDCACAEAGLDAVRAACAGGSYGMVIADEILGALHANVLPLEGVLALMEGKAEGVELVLTGRHAPEAVCAGADLVSDIREVKHYFHAGVPARRGIEE